MSFLLAPGDTRNRAPAAGRDKPEVRLAEEFLELIDAIFIEPVQSSSFATSARSALTSVVLPVEVPPATRMFLRSRTAVASTSH